MKDARTTSCSNVGKYMGQLVTAALQTKTVITLPQAEIAAFGSGNGGSGTIITSQTNNSSWARCIHTPLEKPRKYNQSAHPRCWSIYWNDNYW